MTAQTVESVLGNWRNLEGHTDVTLALGEEIEKNVQVILDANVVLLADGAAGTGKREIDKALKEYSGDEGDALTKLIAQMEKAKKAFQTAQEKARNHYRTEVLGEEAQEEVDSEFDMDDLKAKRKAVLDSLNLEVTFAKANNQTAIIDWATKVSVPQVGRQGSSGVGQSKPRARVSVADTIHESFGEAAKALSESLSTDDTKVVVSSPDLVQAWNDAGSEFDKEFTYRNTALKVMQKETKKRS